MDTGGTEPGGGRFEKTIVSALLLLGLGIALALTVGQRLIHRNPAPLKPVVVEAVPPPDPIEPAALAVLEKFYEAPDTVAKSAFVRDPSRVRLLMADFHDRRNHPYPTLGRVSPGRATEFQSTPCVLFEVEPFRGPRYPVAVMWDDGHFSVDWESLTAYGTMDWSVFTESRPAEPQTLRVFVSAAGEDLKLPGLSKGAGQFQIEHRDDFQPIIAITDAETAAALAPLTNGTRSPVTLEMAWKPAGPGGAPAACVTRLVAIGWSR